MLCCKSKIRIAFAFRSLLLLALARVWVTQEFQVAKDMMDSVFNYSTDI